MGGPDSTTVDTTLAELGTPEGRTDPHPLWRRLREIDPVARTSAGTLVVTGHAPAVAVLGDDRWESLGDRQAAATRDDDGPTAAQTADTLGPVDAARVRHQVSRSFSTANLARRRQQIGNVIDRALDRLADRSEIDLIADFLLQLPLLVLCDLLGVPEADQQLVWQWSEQSADLLRGELDAVREAPEAAVATQLMAHFDPLVDERRRRPGDDLLSELVIGFEAGGLTAVELRKFLFLLVVAGHDTTTSALANGIRALLDHRHELARLRSDPSLVAPAVEEALRFDTAVTAVPRFASVDLELGGHRVAPGGEAVVLLAAANRDPSVFVDPDQFDIGRRPNPHLALGRGTHHCLGAALARVICQETLQRLFARYPAMEPGDPAEYRQLFVLRAPLALHVDLRPARTVE